MDEKESSQIAEALFKLMRTGNDARTQIDFICNTLRIKKKSAARLQKIFETGVHAGCDAVINGEKDSCQDGQPHPLYVTAYQLGREDFKIKLEEQHRRQKPKVFFAGLRLILPIGLILAIIFAVVFIRF